MKRFSLTFVLTIIILGQGCLNDDITFTTTHSQKAIMPRDEIGNLAEAIAEDTIFEKFAESFFDFVILIDVDDALADSIIATQFFHDSNELTYLTISRIDSLLTVYDFSEKSAIVSALDKTLTYNDSIFLKYDIDSFSESQKHDLLAHLGYLPRRSSSRTARYRLL